jgi:hypothetical protein
VFIFYNFIFAGVERRSLTPPLQRLDLVESAGNVVAAVVAESLMVEELAVELVIEDVVVTVVAEVSMAASVAVLSFTLKVCRRS